MDKVATRVSRQEFIRYTSKYLKELPIYITYKGTDDLYLCRASEVATLSKRVVATEDKVATKKSIATDDSWRLRHGCGCEKGEGNLCSKHNRV